MVRLLDAVRRGSFYTGVTTDLARRLRQHNGEIVGALATHGAGARLILCGRKRVMIVPKHKREYVVRRSPRSEKFKLAASYSQPRRGSAS